MSRNESFPGMHKKTVRMHFDRAAASYDDAAVLQQEVCRRMLERLDYMRIQPSTILDVGVGTGFSIPGLFALYPKATLLALDLSTRMLQHTANRLKWYQRPFRRMHTICGDAEKLPLPDQSVDMIFSSLTLQWCTDPELTFAEFRRVLKPEGMLLFSTFGPDTLRELRASWAYVDDHAHVNPFYDMHDLGDALVRARMAEPVMDVDRFTLTYPDVKSLLGDLKKIGATNAMQTRFRGLTGKARWQAFQDAYETYRSQELLPATYEVVYGHAWAAQASRAGVLGQREVSLASLEKPGR
jgi:malonyl-CoA O-methyltransferase